MITGSFASNMHGVPRATQDADVIIEVDQQSLGRFIKSLEEEFYVSLEAANEALEKQWIINYEVAGQPSRSQDQRLPGRLTPHS